MSDPLVPGKDNSDFVEGVSFPRAPKKPRKSPLAASWVAASTELSVARGVGAGKPPVYLTEFVRERGGLADDHREVRNVIGEAKQRPDLVNGKTGQDLDDAAYRAWDAGYFPGEQRPSVSEFLEALREDVHGNRVASARDAGLVEELAVAHDMRVELERKGLGYARSEADITDHFRGPAESGGGPRGVEEAGFDPTSTGTGTKNLSDSQKVAQDLKTDSYFAIKSEVDRYAQARDLVLSGKPFEVGQDIADSVLYHAGDMVNAVPDGANVGSLVRFTPHPTQFDGVILTFQNAGGDRFSMTARAGELFGHGGSLRAITFSNSGGSHIGLMRLVRAEGGDRIGIRAVVGHEITHLVRRADKFPEDAFVELVSHAENLRVLDMPMQKLHEALGLEATSDLRPIREIYNELYKTRPNLDELLAQEAVARSMHGYRLNGEMKPVQHIVDGQVGPVCARRSSTPSTRVHHT